LRAVDFDAFDHLLVMDEQNYKDVISVNPDMAHKVKLMSDMSNSHKGKIIPDPYFGDISGFEQVFQLLDQVSTEIAQNFLPQYR
jgi:protein-tyrosine phosphatase